MKKSLDLSATINQFRAQFENGSQVTVNHHIAITEFEKPQDILLIKSGYSTIGLVGTLLGDIGGGRVDVPEGFKRVKVTFASLFAFDGYEQCFDTVVQTQIIPIDATLTIRDQAIMDAALLNAFELRPITSPLSDHELKTHPDLEHGDILQQGQVALIVIVTNI